jgi:hypothetical protein
MSNAGRIINGSDLAQIQVVDISSVTSGLDSVLDRSVPDRSSGTICEFGSNGSPDDDVHICRPAYKINRRETLMHYIVETFWVFLRKLDTESVTTFQTMYYVVFTIAAVFMVAMPDMHAYYVSGSLGRYYYDMWLMATLVCPSLTMLGRRLMKRAAHTPPNKPNFAYGAAYLQLSGDIGVWGTILVYVTSMMITDWWSKELYTFGFMIMGVAGGAMFTMRSMRRIIQINQRARSETWKT